MPLTDTQIRNAKPTARAYKLFDGGGLHLVINPNGSKLWRLKYRHFGKEKTLSFGAYPHTSLRAARPSPCVHRPFGHHQHANSNFKWMRVRGQSTHCKVGLDG